MNQDPLRTPLREGLAVVHHRNALLDEADDEPLQRILNREKLGHDGRGGVVEGVLGILDVEARREGELVCWQKSVVDEPKKGTCGRIGMTYKHKSSPSTNRQLDQSYNQ